MAASSFGIRNSQSIFEDELFNEMNETDTKEKKKKYPYCEVCVRQDLAGRYESIAVFLCFMCEVYLCDTCMNDHWSHEGMRVGIEESKRPEERSECDKMRIKFLDELMNESAKEREEEFQNDQINICGRVKVKHELDQTGCRITGLCGLNNKNWVACDENNSCIKIFEIGSNVLQRYIRFTSRPCGVTEITVQHNSPEPDLVSGSSSGFSVVDRDKQNKPCFLAVTLPMKRQIILLQLHKKPAEKHKSINTDKKCYDIQFYSDKLFTLCSGGSFSHWYVYEISTGGNILNEFYIDTFKADAHGLTVISEGIFLTDYHNHRVQCRNFKGQVLSEILIPRSMPSGINADPDNNVYICAQGRNHIYKLDSDLTQYKAVLEKDTDYIKEPYALFYHRHKLFIAHSIWSPLDNYVTVVQLL